MTINAAILQFGGSLVAILLLAWLAYWFGLGGSPRIASEDDARKLASEVVYGFDAIECAVDSGGESAILADRNSRILVLKRHGSHFAGRIIGASSKAHLANGQLLIDSGERRFGTISLRLSDGTDWAKRIEALKGPSHA